MKTLHIASILALSTLLTFACGDDDETNPNGTSGKGGSAQAGDNGGGEDAGGKAGSSQGGTNSQAGAKAEAGADVGGAGGVPAVTCEFGNYGEGGASDAGGASAGGAAGAGGQASGGLEVLGSWTEIFDGEPAGTLEVTSSHWNDSGIAAYDSEANLVYTQTPCDDEYNPGAFTKIVYTEPAEDAFYYCTVVFDAKTLAEAQASDLTADPEDLEAGCGGQFPWSKVTR